MSYRFNNGRGGVTCDKCNILYDANLSYDEYVQDYGDEKVPDVCAVCADKAKKKRKEASAYTD
jgi:hypothetical protein